MAIDKRYMHDEEALSTDEINRRIEERNQIIKKTCIIIFTLAIVVGTIYLISLVNFKKISADRKKVRQAKTIIIDPNLSPKYKGDFIDDNDNL